MMRFVRRAGYMMALCVLVAACGFRPLYTHTDTLSGDGSRFDQIEIDAVNGIEQTRINTDRFVDNISSVNAHNLRNALIDRFYHNGYPDRPAYLLKINVLERGRDIVLERDDTKSRAQVVIVAYYKLLDKATRQEVDAGNIRAASSYNILSSEYTTSVTREHARDMALRDLADKITLRMAVVLGDKSE